ncbi:MAG: hypothetical protein R2708_18480 [Vicinamibacterales bacterium]
MALAPLAGSRWLGTAELWLDPLGNEAQTSPCTIELERDEVRYTWAYQGAPHRGTITLGGEGGTFVDSWHSPAPMPCRAAPSWAPVDLIGSYAAGDGPAWGWRLLLSLRPASDGAPEALVLQMVNIAPWGEETRAVRMIATRA